MGDKGCSPERNGVRVVAERAGLAHEQIRWLEASPGISVLDDMHVH